MLGDLNGYRYRARSAGRSRLTRADSGIEPLLDNFAVDPMESLAAHERWTHFRRYWSDKEREH